MNSYTTVTEQLQYSLQLFSRCSGTVGRVPRKNFDPERGKRISELISARGYDMQGGVTRLAKEVGVGRNMVYDWKRGEAPNLANLERLAEVLSTTITWITSGSEPKHPPPELLSDRGPDPG